jgi:DNA-binding NarL/FixJ family response regulator
MSTAPATAAREIIALAMAAPSRQAFRAEVLRLMIAGTRAGAGSFMQLNPTLAPLEQATIQDMDMSSIDRCAAGWEAMYAAEVEALALASMTGGGVALDTRVLDARERSRRAFYADILRPAGIREALYCVVGVGDDEFAVLGLHNQSARDVYTDETLSLVRALLPVISLADGLLGKLDLRVADEVPLAGLSRREREVVELVALGYTNAEIAAALGTSLLSVRNQLSRVFRKAGVTTRAELVGLLARRRLPAAPPSLAPRLRVVFELLHSGASEKQIAARLGLTAGTLHQYVKAVYRAVGVKSRAQLMARAIAAR